MLPRKSPARLHHCTQSLAASCRRRERALAGGSPLEPLPLRKVERDIGRNLGRMRLASSALVLREVS
jgi:hypothetical protein